MDGRKDWDIIIVGGGSAGAIVAGLLAERWPGKSVLLPEAGPSDRRPRVKVPLGLVKLMGSERFDWRVKSAPNAALNDAKASVPRGKVLGGSGSINSMLYVRGRAQDYDSWAEAGATGWSWEDVLPVFKRMEGNRRLGDAPLHGATGPMIVEDQTSPHPLTRSLIEAGEAQQIRPSKDFNGEDQEGLGLYQVNMKKGRRWTGVDAYLQPALGRPGSRLTVETGVEVDRIDFQDRRAEAVVLRDGRRLQAKERIILCAGAIGTPTILLRSGVGPGGSTLDLPGVGQNLSDHAAAPVSFRSATRGHGIAWRNIPWVLNAPIRYMRGTGGMLSSPTIEAGGFVKTRPDIDHPDVQFHFGPFNLGYWGHGYFADACVLQPKSRGSLTLQADGSPKIDLNLLAHEEDFQTLKAGWKLLRDILLSQAFGGQSDRMDSPNINPYDEGAIEDWLRHSAFTSYHPVGTAKMGAATDSTAVVNPESMGVYGVEKLSVVDASVMPNITSGNTNNPAMMIAERAARTLIPG